MPATPATAGAARVERSLELLSIPLLLLLWQLLALLLQHRLFPGPVGVAQALWAQLTAGPLLSDLARTLGRASAAFVLAMLGGTVLGLLLGRIGWLDRLLGPWLVIGLNLPAIVTAILLYIWLGLTDGALILAVTLNKLPLVAATVREGVRSLSPEFDELARALRLAPVRRLSMVVLPQLVPFLLAAARTGLSLIWKIVLVFEVLGSDGGVGYRLSIFFQFFDIAAILAYTAAFIAVVLMFEYIILRPLERRVRRWRAA